MSSRIDAGVGLMKTFTVRVPDETVGDLDRLAQKMDRSRSFIAAQAIEDYVARETWQIAEIEAGIAEADRGEFAEAEDVRRIVDNFTLKSFLHERIAEAQRGELDTRSMTEIADSASQRA
jgi:predicted transcriptional regulator